MLVSMAGFTINDACIKLAASNLPLGQLIVIRNTFATVFILLAIAILGAWRIPRDPPAGLVALRLVGEVGATLLYLSALLLMPIADVTAIGQFTPLAVTAAAALVLAEPVGWRRWAAAGVGLAGVLLIVRPGSSVFTPAALLALGSIAFVVLRDLATRQISTGLTTLHLTLVSSLAVLASGLLLSPFDTWGWPSGAETALLAAAGFFLVGGYVFIIVAMRTGEIAAVSPFRYSVILFALMAGWIIWSELPDPISLAGIAVVTGAGLYTFHREHVRGALRRPMSRGPG